MGTHSKTRRLSLDLIIQIGVGLCLLAYAGYRAAKLEFVYDEACSYFWYARTSCWDLYLGVPPDANNHWLNSLFMKVSLSLFGATELALRWHSVAALGVYLAAVITWLRSIRDPFLRLMGFLALTCNPYLLDFFSLARGYGLAMMFTFCGAACVCRWVASGNRRWGLAAVLCGIAAVLSNLCALLFYGAVMAVVCLKGMAGSLPANGSWRQVLPRFWKTTRWAWWGTLAAVAILTAPLVRLMQAHAFYVGGQNGFWKDTVHTLVCDSLYRVNYGRLQSLIVYGVEGVVAVSLVVGALIAFGRAVQRGWAVLEESWVVMFVLVGTAGAASIVLHVVFKANYLYHRLATFFLPLYLMYAVLLAQAFWLDIRCRRQVARGVTLAIMLACGLHLCRSANAKWTYEWRYNYQTREVLSDLLRDARQNGLTEVRLGVSVLFHPSVGYYREVDHLAWLVAVEKDWGGQTFDYYYVKDGLDAPPDGGRGLVTVKVYPDIETRLLRREGRRRPEE